LAQRDQTSLPPAHLGQRRPRLHPRSVRLPAAPGLRQRPEPVENATAAMSRALRTSPMTPIVRGARWAAEARTLSVIYDAEGPHPGVGRRVAARGVRGG
jgi:hypothetical protein